MSTSRRTGRVLRVVVSALLAVFVMGVTAPLGHAAAETGPPLSVPRAALDASLDCDAFTHPEHEPVLLVHGTFTHGKEQWDWTWRNPLRERGFDTCVVTYPDRGLGDMQVSAEYVVDAVRRVSAATGSKVDVVGHSQGGILPRWALRWWPDVRAAVDDYVGLASPNHGVGVLDGTLAAANLLRLPLPEVIRQFGSASAFTRALNSGDETPGDVDYTDIYTTYDEAVRPVAPVPTAALDWNRGNPKAANVLLQDVCPGRLVEHAYLGLFDRATFELTVDALAGTGPANIPRAGGPAICGPLPAFPTPVLDPTLLEDLLDLLPGELATLPVDLHLTTREPPLRDYATG
ncbi:MAG: alpha/beta fold hydrolase [Streptomycetaceae bacterium]|nr:alpha/beta fold hydrolase [Streptomycetaceae bacterium]